MQSRQDGAKHRRGLSFQEVQNSMCKSAQHGHQPEIVMMVRGRRAAVK
jgi:hypothetical protein